MHRMPGLCTQVLTTPGADQIPTVYASLLYIFISTEDHALYVYALELL
jgi:hypothetical protein